MEVILNPLCSLALLLLVSRKKRRCGELVAQIWNPSLLEHSQAPWKQTRARNRRRSIQLHSVLKNDSCYCTNRGEPFRKLQYVSKNYKHLACLLRLVFDRYRVRINFRLVNSYEQILMICFLCFHIFYLGQSIILIVAFDKNSLFYIHTLYLD